MSGGPPPTLKPSAIIGQSSPLRPSLVLLQFTAQWCELTFKPLAQIHECSLKMGEHLLGGGIVDSSAGLVLQSSQQCQHGRKGAYQGVPPRIFE